MANANSLSVFISQEARELLWAYIKQTDDEIGGFGYGKLNPAGFVDWHDTFIVPQVAGPAEVDYTTRGIPFAIERAAHDGVLNDPDFIWIKWHSHHHMGAYWSGTDDDANKQLRAAGIPYLIDFVGNHKYEYKIRAELYENRLGLAQITIDKVAWMRDPDDELEVRVAGEIAALVEKPKPKTYPTRAPLPGDKVEQALVVRDKEHEGNGGQCFDQQAWGELGWDDTEESKDELHEMLSHFSEGQLRDMGVEVINGEVVNPLDVVS